MITLSLAPHVGAFIAATDVPGTSLLAIVLAAGLRGEHRGNVLDMADGFRRVADFRVPSRAESGVTPVVSDGHTLFVADDHSLLAIAPRTGETIWERTFDARLRLLDAKNGRLLVTIDRARLPVAHLLRASDGSVEADLEDAIVASLGAPSLDADGSVAVAGMRFIDLLRAGTKKARLPLAMKRFGAIDCAELEAGRLIVGSRAGEAVVVDLASGASQSVMELPRPIVAVGFHRDAPWAMDDEGHLRIGEASIDLAMSTWGGLVLDDARTMALSDRDARTFQVRSLPSGEVRFATIPGFACTAVGIDAEGALFVSNDEKLIRIDASTGKTTKIGAGATDVTRLPGGSLVLVGSGAALLGASGKPVKLARAIEGVTIARGHLVATNERAIETWDLARAERTFRIDLERTWVGQTNDAIDAAYVGPDARPWVHLSDGSVWRADAMNEPAIGKLSPAGTLHVHPDGERLLRVDGRRLTWIALPSFEESAPLTLPIDEDVHAIAFSPSRRYLALAHRDGRRSILDLESRSGVVIDRPTTSAAERAPNQIFVVDLSVSLACAFGKDEKHLAFVDAGGITFAHVATGAIAGRLVLATNGKDFVVTDGTSIDWPGAAKKKRISSEIVVGDAGASRRVSALLATLTA